MDLLMPMCEVQHTSKELSNQTKVEDTEGTHIRTRIQHEDTSHDEGHCEKTISQLSKKKIREVIRQLGQELSVEDLHTITSVTETSWENKFKMESKRSKEKFERLRDNDKRPRGVPRESKLKHEVIDLGWDR